MTTLPTGTQYEISHGQHRAVVTEVGATLRVYSVEGRDVLSGFAEDAVVTGGRGMQLLPWPNRVRDGQYTFDGTEYQLDLTEPKRHNAIHGLVRHVAWQLLSHSADSVVQRVVVYPQPGWPSVLEATVTHTVSAEGLLVEVSATNIGAKAVPFGYAAHPYFTVGEEAVDEITLVLPAASYLEVDADRMLPIEQRSVEGTDKDFRSGRRLDTVNLDTAFTDLERDADGRCRVKLSLGDRYAEMWGDENMTWLQVFTGEHRRDIALAVEPMTCGPNAFNPGPTEDGMIVLAPGDSWQGRWGVVGR